MGWLVDDGDRCDTGSVRVLLIEDESALARVVERSLVEDGYAVDVAGTARRGGELVLENDYDVAVVDIGLPDGLGTDLCRGWRERGEHLPVLMLTARDGLSDKVSGLDSGADDYMSKPFDMPELAARIRALLRRPTTAQPTVLTHRDIALDPSTRRVWRGAITVPVTTREFAVLEYLLRNAGRVVAREEILEHVWDAHYDGLSNVVDVHIASLRRKLAMPDSPTPIGTVRGVGYELT